MKTSKEIRDDFLKFFKEKNHTLLSSASLLPVGDATLLFTNAGMNQFKDIFLGQGKRDFTRAANTQKCMRVSGKHNDLDDVGRDTYHHTFFEMLGNWSFGDYYKKEAITWAWELLTEVWGLPKEKLYATVFRDDQEAAELWRSETDIAPERIMRFDEKDNFWEMGETGPCGPCSEIHIDQGEGSCDLQHIPGHICGVNAGCSRYIELWNLVFIQFDRQPDGSLNPLPAKHVDTGMGFERVVSILQGVKSNYDTDLFKPLLSQIELLTGQKYETADRSLAIAMRVIADHIRSLAFSIADGIMPSNEGRGYVIRRILRRALRFGQKLGLAKPFLGELLPILEEVMGEAFPELKRNQARINEVLKHEEIRYFETLDAGMRELNDLIARVKSSGGDSISGQDVFRLYDSRGFPAEIIQEVAEDEGLQVDFAGFESLMEEQKKRGRESWKSGQAEDFSKLPVDLVATRYRGEDEFCTQTELLFILEAGKTLSSLKAGSEAWLVFRATPFYAEGGGQVSDSGLIRAEGMQGAILSVVDHGGVYLHRARLESGELKLGQEVELAVESERKLATARNHTATHLLQQALIEVLGEHIAQAGSAVSSERLRFDFSHFKAVESDELFKVESLVNQMIRENLSLEKEIMDREQAVKNGAKAFFGEKYEDQVRVVKIGDFSQELCGGTHVERTGDIGFFKILGETSVASGVRRIEALTGQVAILKIQEEVASLQQLSRLLNLPESQVHERVVGLLESLKKSEKELNRLKTALAISELIQNAANQPNEGGLRIIVKRIDGVDVRVLKESVDEIRNRYSDAIVLVGTVTSDEKCLLVLGAAREALERGFDARASISEIARLIDGSGGGRKDLAQAGGRDKSKLDEALKAGLKMLQEKFS